MVNFFVTQQGTLREDQELPEDWGGGGRNHPSRRGSTQVRYQPYELFCLSKIKDTGRFSFF